MQPPEPPTILMRFRLRQFLSEKLLAIFALYVVRETSLAASSEAFSRWPFILDECKQDLSHGLPFADLSYDIRMYD
jgi:hypothetical protein